MAADKPVARRLGRGLDALLGQKPVATGNTVEHAIAPTVSELRDIPIADIRANHYQPRKEFDVEELKELQDSIAATGLLQPITVRQVAGTPGYEIVAGERRFRAVSRLGWTTIPALVREYDDRTTLTLALVENLQRTDLNPIEEAEGYAHLSSEFGLTQNEIAALVGKDRSTIANLLRVLQLPSTVRRMLENGELTMGHARPLLSLEDEKQILALAKEAAEMGLSVRSIEQRVRQDAPKPSAQKRGRPMKVDHRPTEIRHVEEMIRQRLQTDVTVSLKKKQQGELRVQFYSYDDLNRLLDLMGALKDE